MWSTLRDAKGRCKNRRLEAHRNKQALFSGERSYEISSKVRKRTNFQFLIFKVRFKDRWKEKPITNDAECSSSKSNKKIFYYQSEFSEFHEKESVNKDLMMVNGTTRRETKFIMDCPGVDQGKIEIRKFGWKKLLSRFVYFSEKKANFISENQSVKASNHRSSCKPWKQQFFDF
jgi:hypothetical protein